MYILNKNINTDSYIKYDNIKSDTYFFNKQNNNNKIVLPQYAQSKYILQGGRTNDFIRCEIICGYKRSCIQECINKEDTK